ncbi:MAG: hypothetical protein HOG89_00870 [Candidatus Peribacter sp.]|jgi:hypothetical protein|nr:hypothetical protein [Candidatus Peribacter sp.]MBT4392926.1 hypothetical protein [Candidatus Peribacter sp.]MBT4600986.1 hypothetical protein [Candidatus Peribacter sp.]MBT5149028.1 hypothetical protein [Candidatus Peribacter sp.]MBT5637352.1 hypothetical protein [Candidatus Peribacter sp.]
MLENPRIREYCIQRWVHDSWPDPDAMGVFADLLEATGDSRAEIAREVAHILQMDPGPNLETVRSEYISLKRNEHIESTLVNAYNNVAERNG